VGRALTHAEKETMLYTLSLYLMAILYTLAGIWHFVRPAVYLKIMPPYLPNPLLLVQLSGIAEIICGILLIIPRTRALGAWATIALLIAVLPANYYMLQKGGAAFRMPQWVLIARIPLQFVLMYWAYCYT
jgi:uncharacterized membrane protein